MKKLFKFILTVQVFSVAWAQFYGNPDAEFINTRGSTGGTTLDQFIIDAAIRRGMDGDAVAELLRTRQPVVRVKIEPPGVKKTTTYKLDSDGSISSKTLTEIYGGSVPDSSYTPKSNGRTVTRTFTSSGGPQAIPSFGDDSGDNWFGSIGPTQHHSSGFPPVSPWPSESRTGTRQQTKIYTNKNGDRRIVETITGDEAPTNYHQTVNTFRGPNGETRVVKTFSSHPWDAESPTDPEEPSTILHSKEGNEFPTNYRQTTKTFRGPNGETHVVKTFSTNPFESQGFPSIESPIDGPSPVNTRPSQSWPSFGSPYFPSSWLPQETMGDPDEWTVVEDDTTESTTSSKLPPATSTTVQSKVLSTEATSTPLPKRNDPELKVTTPLPSLDEFLKSRYGPTTTSSKKETVATTKNPTLTTTTPKPKTQTTKTPNPSSATTTTKKPIHINIEDLPVTEVLHNGKPADEDLMKKLPSHLQPKLDTGNVLRIENKHPMEVELPEAIEPNRRVASTSFQGPPTTFTSFYENTRPLEFSPPLSPISAFLARLNLTKADILARSGEYTQTIAEDDGSLLQVRFILSSPIHRPMTKNIPFK
ncbi:mucin-2 [Musca domestica]|uniref:Mucin-5AC n=1 Tax=Musca domestica TaxID=7370 RepID=T1PF70_MUSDO|nr:mucin-2 [Musca domestica]